MTTLTATAARREFVGLVKRAVESHRVFRIRHQLGTVILMSEEDYDGLKESVELLSLPGFRRRLAASGEQVKAGNTVSGSELFKEDAVPGHPTRTHRGA